MPGGHLLVHGPFKVDGEWLGADDWKFDEKLRSTNAEWGVRDVAELSALSSGFGLTLRAKFAMPADNLVLHFVKD